MEKVYNRILSWIRHNKVREQYIIFICRYLPYLTAIMYLGVLGYTFLSAKEHLVAVLAIPVTSFLSVTIIRKIWNRPRPYETLLIDSLFSKKKGESCPSRHTASAFAIAIAGYVVLPNLGIVLLILATIIALSRFIAGVHYPSDILLAIGIVFFISWVIV